jgi:hypothetical protein
MKTLFGYFPILLPAVLLVPGCMIHSHNVQGAKSSGSSSGDARVEGEGESTAVRSETPDCTIPEGFSFAQFGPALPQVVASSTIETNRADATLIVDKDGGAYVKFNMELKNAGSAADTAMVGYAWRKRMIGKQEAQTRIDFKAGEVKTCYKKSDQHIQQPFENEVHYVEVTIDPGASTNVVGGYKVVIARADKPETLFGFHDRFSRNWKNWDWPYTKAPQYKSVAADLTPFHGTFLTAPAAESRIILRNRDELNWTRTMSHEQYVTRLRTPGAHAWNLTADQIPVHVEFEYLPGLDIQKELEAFEKIVKANPGDLRAWIRLADLELYGGDPAKRVKGLKKLLDVWDQNAKKQLLTGRNDVRGPAYVALVKSLLQLGKKAEASRFAKKGLKLLDSLDANLEMNKLAARWLEGVAVK